jgi:hypothetical protein
MDAQIPDNQTKAKNRMKLDLFLKEGECGWARNFLEFILGSGLNNRVVRFVANPLLTCAVMFGLALVACAVSIIANTHVGELILSVSGSALGAEKIEQPMRFGYLFEPNFFLWLTCFLPILASGISYSIVMVARALKDFSAGNFPRLRWPLQPSETSRKTTVSRIILLFVFAGLPALSCYFQQIALSKAIQLPRIADDEAFAKAFDFGNTQAPTIGALVDRFNSLKTGEARFSAVVDRKEQIAAIKDELSKKLPNAHLDLKEAVQKGELFLQMSFVPDEKRFNNALSHIAYPAYLLIVYTLVGLGWSLAIFAIYLLAAQFFLWYRLIRDGSLELRYDSKDKDFGLRQLTDILRVFYVLVVVGASYLLLQSVSCERGGTIELRMFNIILVALTALIFIVGLAKIELETRNRRNLYIQNNGLEEAIQNATTKDEQELAKDRLNLVKAQRFLRFSTASISKYGLPVVALTLYPFWPGLDKQISDIWNKVDASWIGTICRIFPGVK